MADTPDALRVHRANIVELEVEFEPDEYDLTRLVATLQWHRIVEHAAIGLALLFLPHLARGEVTHVTKRGEATDYWVDGDRCLLEAGGTGEPRRLRSYHHQKVERSRDNPYALPFFVAVTSFGNLRAIFSYREVDR